MSTILNYYYLLEFYIKHPFSVFCYPPSIHPWLFLTLLMFSMKPPLLYIHICSFLLSSPPASPSLISALLHDGRRRSFHHLCLSPSFTPVLRPGYFPGWWGSRLMCHAGDYRAAASIAALPACSRGRMGRERACRERYYGNWASYWEVMEWERASHGITVSAASLLVSLQLVYCCAES